MKQPVAQVTCEACKGLGELDLKICPVCEGKGSVLVASPATRCQHCAGSGLHHSSETPDDDGHFCPMCRGAGWAIVVWPAEHFNARL